MPAPPVEPPSSGGIHVGEVGGDLSFSALGDIVGGDKITTITTTIQISVEAITQRELITASPYRGLDRFEDRDAALFFGRDQLIRPYSRASVRPMCSLFSVHRVAANHPSCEPACCRGCRNWSARGFAILRWFPT
jgi:hypothetical protein